MRRDSVVHSFYEACVMDGGRTVFRIRIARCMHNYVERTPGLYMVGSVLRISDYTLVKMHGKARWTWNVVMLVHDFCLHCCPASVTTKEGSGVVVLPPNTQGDKVHRRVIAKVVHE